MGQVVKGGAISFNEIRNAFGSPEKAQVLEVLLM